MMPRRMPPMPPNGPRKMNWNTAKRLLSYLKDFKFHMILVLLCIGLSSLVGVISSMFLQTLIDDYISPLLIEAVPNFSGLLRAIMVMAVIYLIGIIATWLYNRTMALVSQGTLKKVRDDMFSHMQKLPIKYFDTNTHGDVMSHFTNDADTLRQMISQSVPQAFSSIITIVMVFSAMISISVPLTLFVFLFVAIMMKFAGKITGKSGKYFRTQQKTLGEVNGYIEEMVNGQRVVKVFCYEDRAKEIFDEKNERLRDCVTKANSYVNILMPFMNNMGHVLYVLLAILGGVMAISNIPNLSLSGMGAISLGAIASFLQLSKSFIMPISHISQQMSSIVMAMAGAERIFSLMDEATEVDDGYVSLVNVEIKDGELVETDKRTGLWAWKHPHKDGSITYKELRGNVVFDDVDFGYTEEKTVLHNISMHADEGQKIAFVGATGAGKTTITNLINRFYDIADGKIRYDGININKIKKEDLRRSLGIVLQDVNLFTGTVMENIRYGKLDATDEECIAAAKLANADGFIRMLPEGYNTVISGDGSGLSQGQRQLISIARAAVADPPVMILDEATSSIDTRTEAIVQKGMDSLMKGRTVFVIAHRLSTIKNADVIMVMDKGQIIERGNHEFLMEQKGKYYQLYTGAFELE